MSQIPLAGRLAPLVLLLLALPASAQMLPSGTWAGTYAEADGDRRPVTAAVERCDGGFTVVLDLDGQRAEVPAERPARYRRGRLQFETSRVRMPGTLVPRALTCDLRVGDDGALSGTCASGRAAYRLALAPPAAASVACDDSGG